eukprot:scaffold42709_cov103-Cyclotella_meneghiniana.AAC.8
MDMPSSPAAAERARVFKTFLKSLLTSPNGPTTSGITCSPMNLFCADSNGPTIPLSPLPTMSAAYCLSFKPFELIAVLLDLTSKNASPDMKLHCR